jgi:hypothetical protein
MNYCETRHYSVETLPLYVVNDVIRLPFTPTKTDNYITKYNILQISG